MGILFSKYLYQISDLLKVTASTLISKNIFYHGSPYKFSVLNANSYVTSNLQHARIFAVQWSSSEVLNDPPKDGKFIFKSASSMPNPHPIYIYEIESKDIEPSLTNMGESYEEVFKTKKSEKIKLIESYGNWQDIIPYSIAE